MVNSASASLAEFKTRQLGGLMSGVSSSIAAPTVASTSLDSTVAARQARLAPKKSTSAFMDQVRKSGQSYHQTAMQGFQQRQQQRAFQGGVQTSVGGGGYQLPKPGGKPQTGGKRGQYGITLDAGAALNRLKAAYAGAGMGNLTVNSGGRTFEQQADLYAKYKAGRGNKAAPPGTSLHESGIAVDFGGPLYNTNMQAAMRTKQHAWMRQNAAQFKWFWVGKNFGESWHWEYHPEW